jgi:hypothetical protein
MSHIQGFERNAPDGNQRTFKVKEKKLLALVLFFFLLYPAGAAQTARQKSRPLRRGT